MLNTHSYEILSAIMTLLTSNHSNKVKDDDYNRDIYHDKIGKIIEILKEVLTNAVN